MNPFCSAKLTAAYFRTTMPKRNLYVAILLLCITRDLNSQNADIKLLRQLNVNRNKHLDTYFTICSNSIIPVSIGVPLSLYLYGLHKKDSLFRSKAIVAGGSLAVASVITFALKYSIGRPRPFVTYPDIQKLSDGGSQSVPSGHSSNAFSIATSFSIEWPRWYVAVPAYTWAASVAYSRMHLGVHYPSDVLCGAAMGAGSAWLCHWANKKWKTKRIGNIIRKKVLLGALQSRAVSTKSQ